MDRRVQYGQGQLLGFPRPRCRFRQERTNSDPRVTVRKINERLFPLVQRKELERDDERLFQLVQRKEFVRDDPSLRRNGARWMIP